MTRLALAPTGPAERTRCHGHWWYEVIVLGALYLLYDGIRLVVSADADEAFGNAHRVLDLEHRLGMAHEQTINHLVSAWPPIAVVMSYSYATLHYLVTPVVLIWLWKRRPRRYQGARTALVVATLLGLLGFWLFPTAPPRMLDGFVDTLAKYHQWGWWGGDASAPKGLGSMTNEFAAMPSLHVGWAAWCGWQVARSVSNRVVRALAIGYPIWIFAVVVGTANHYILDTVAGLAVIAAGMAFVILARRYAPRSPAVLLETLRR